MKIEELTKEELLRFSRIALLLDFGDPELIASTREDWNPLDNSAQAFQLFVALEMDIGEYNCGDYHDWSTTVSASARWYQPQDNVELMEFYRDNLKEREYVFRQAVTLVAARIGKHYLARYPDKVKEW